MGQPSVLLVDDDAGCRIALLHNLALRNIKVSCVTNGEEALRELQRSPMAFTAIVLDLRMPVMDGTEFLRRYKGDRPVILTSGYGTECDLPRPVHMIIPKPIDVPLLVDTILDLASTNPSERPAER
jgi:DNA-binding NtrC family response regulator